MAMSFAVKELLAALEGFVSNFIEAESTPAVIKKETNKIIKSHPPLHHKLYSSTLNFISK